MAETEAGLLRRFTGSGDAEAFAEIIRRHAGLVYGAALRILADVDRASDVAQETFLQLTKDAGSVTGSLPGWLHRVATHKAIDQMRREASRRHREKEYVAREERPREVAEWKEISPYVDIGLRELAPEFRDVLILHFLEGRTTREIAAAQNTSQATVSRRIGSGVEQLRAKLRRRGVLVAIGALSALLGDNAVQAAPLPLLTELGKMAMVGGAAAGTAGAGSGLHTVASSVLTAIKTKAMAVAAVAVIGAGSAVTYHEMKKSSSGPAVSLPAGFAIASPGRSAAGSPTEVQSRPAPPSNLPQAETQWDPPAVAAQNLTGSLGGETPAAELTIMHPTRGETESAPKGTGGSGGMMMGGMDGMATAGSPAPQEDTAKPQADQTGGSYSYDHPSGGRDPNRPADPNYRDPNSPATP